MQFGGDWWYVTGLVCDGAQAVRVALPSPLLVFDVEDWARAQRAYWCDEARLAEEDGDAETAAEYRELATELAAWLQHPTRVVKGMPLLTLRQTARPRVVTTHSLYAYLHCISGHLGKSPDGGTVQFVLDLGGDGGQITLYATAAYRAQARHTGGEILGVVLSDGEMAARVLAYPSVRDVPTGTSVLDVLFGCDRVEQ